MINIRTSSSTRIIAESHQSTMGDQVQTSKSTPKTMEYRRLGKSGLRVSPFILGMMSYGTSTWQPWVLDEEPSKKLVKAAFDAGINTFDTADTYSNGQSEVVLGNALKEYDIAREQVVILTKCYFCVADKMTDLTMGKPPSALQPDFGSQYINRVGLSRKHIFEAVDHSLKRLQTDYIDVLQIHRLDKEVEAEEIMEALHDVVKSGKVRYIGASSMYTWEFQRLNHVAQLHGWTQFISMQNFHNLIYREEEREMLPYCKSAGIGVIPWSPLARGALTRPYKSDASRDSKRAGSDRMYKMIIEASAAESDEHIIGAVEQLAQRKGCTMSQIAMAWSRDKITAPIIGISSEKRLHEAIESLNITLTEEDKEELEKHYVPRKVLGHA